MSSKTESAKVIFGYIGALKIDEIMMVDSLASLSMSLAEMIIELFP